MATFQEHIKHLVDKEGVVPLAARLHVSRQTILNWRKGMTPPVKIIEMLGGEIVFPETEDNNQ